MNTLKKTMLLLLLACLCACGREENLAAQNKPKTIKQTLCKTWKLESDWHNDTYTKEDSFRIIFYENHTFIFYAVPKWNLTSDRTNILKGTWQFGDPTAENISCFENGVCFDALEIIFSCKNLEIAKVNSPIGYIFNHGTDTWIRKISDENLQFGGFHELTRHINLNFIKNK